MRINHYRTDYLTASPPDFEVPEIHVFPDAENHDVPGPPNGDVVSISASFLGGPSAEWLRETPAPN